MIEIKMPEAGFSVTEGTVVEWYKEVGDRVREGENLVRVETEKITVDIPAESSGVLQEIRSRSGEVVLTGSVLGVISESAGAAAEKITPAVWSVSPLLPGNTVGQAPGTQRLISPAAKALARSKNVDLSLILGGSGPGGRIVKQDVQDQLGSMEAVQADGMKRSQLNRESPPLSDGRQRIEFRGWRKVIADRMLESAQQIPHYTMSVEADVTELSRTIARLRQKDEKLHITYLPFMMKAMILGIREIARVNALADRNGYTIHDEVNIGIAVDLGEKLLVPVIRDVQNKSILELVHGMDELVNKARADRLATPDIEGGTITLTNVGMFQTISATSLILPPQVAIVYMGVARDMPAVWEGKIEVRKRMVFGATYDHRVINGADGGRFLKTVKDCLEDSSILLLQMR